MDIPQLYDKGCVSQEVLLLYAISGDLPSKTDYNKMGVEEKQKFWHSRLKERLGSRWKQWRDYVNVNIEILHDWAKEGF